MIDFFDCFERLSRFGHFLMSRYSPTVVMLRHEIHRLAIGYEVAERQTARVGMVHQLAETDGESADSGRHQHIRAGGRLRAAL